MNQRPGKDPESSNFSRRPKIYGAIFHYIESFLYHTKPVILEPEILKYLIPLYDLRTILLDNIITFTIVPRDTTR